MRKQIRVFLLLAITVSLGIILAYWWATPRLLEVSPYEDEPAVPASSAIRITFSRSMQIESVSEHLTISPESEVSYDVNGKTLLIIPKENWPAGVRIQVDLKSGAKSSDWINLPLKQGKSWSFVIRQPRLIYLYPAEGPANLYLLNPMSGEQIALTSSPGGIEDFSISPDNKAIYYSMREGYIGSAIYRFDLSYTEGVSSQLKNTKQYQLEPDLIYTCSRALCSTPVVSPGNKYLAFERTALPGGEGPNYPQVWYLEFNQETSPESGTFPAIQSEPKLAATSFHQTLQPTWSSKGILAYYDTNASAFIFLDPLNETRTNFPNQTGQAGTWHPDGNHFVAPEIMFLNTSETIDDLDQIASSHLIAFNIADGRLEDLTPGEELEDTAPEFSPDGHLLAFARKYLDIESWTPGRQIWITITGEYKFKQFTNEPLFNHFKFAWSPSGELLAYVRFNQSVLTKPPEIWLLDPTNARTTRLVIGGYDPQWIP